MPLLESIHDLIGEEDESYRYECPECGHTRETDAPPERAICNACSHEELTLTNK